MDNSGRVIKAVISEGESCAIRPFIAQLSGVRKRPLPTRFTALPGAGNQTPATIRPQVPHQEGSGRSRDPTPDRGSSMGDQSMECIRDGLDWYPLPSPALHTNG